MYRRDFLRAVIVGAGATMFEVGCSSDPAETPLAIEEGLQFFPQSIASGDPKPESVILWARVEDATVQSGLSVALEVATDEGFAEKVSLEGKTRITTTADPAFDGCVKIKVKGLKPGTTYYYRFLYLKDGKGFASKTGRTKTAPAEDADAKVKLAFVSCQDLIGRYYNTYLLLLEENVDFFVFLGDYIYETTGDPTFQNASGTRKIKLTDTAGAIVLHKGEPSEYYAAKSLSNYRELYKQYRADKVLQAVHEKTPMIATWDDHEFTDDCFGATGTYFADKVDETDVGRRKAANQAWFEYMPVDYQTETFKYDPAANFPGDIKIWRDFTFGKHLHLVMTDERTYRVNHPIPEGGLPGEVVLDQAKLTANGGQIPADADFYVDIDTHAGGMYKTALTAAATPIGYDAAKIKGKITVGFINAMVAEINKTKQPGEQIAAISDTTGLERGMSWAQMGKTGFYSSVGSRFLIMKEPFDRYASIKFAETQGASEEVLGKEQEAWLLDKIKTSKKTWKMWGNGYCLMPIQIDLSTLPVPLALAKKWYLSLDGWDGQRNKRSAIINELSSVPNVVAITGDVHAFYAATPHVNDDPSKKIIELVTSSISSATYSSLIDGQAKKDPNLSKVVGIDQLIANMDKILTGETIKSNPHLGYGNSFASGFAVIELDGAALTCTFHMVLEEHVKKEYVAAAQVKAVATKETFKVNAGERELYRSMEGTFKKWDMTQVKWV
jgi:alkaline phosphatase D